MRRMPNPWVAIPVLVASIAGGAVGWFVTDASCAPDSCGVMAGSVAAIAAIGTGIGVGVVRGAESSPCAGSADSLWRNVSNILLKSSTHSCHSSSWRT